MNTTGYFPIIESSSQQSQATEHALQRVTRELLQLWGAVSLDDALDLTARKNIHELLSATINEGIKNGKEQDLKALHFTLDELLRLRYVRDDRKLELSPFLFELQQRIIKAVIAHDINEIAQQGGFEGCENFGEWYQAKLAVYADGPHPLFHYIEEEAGLDGFRALIQQEAGVHVAFDDVLAFAQIGVHGTPKVEFFHNFEDEMGSGDPDKFHLTMFGRLLHELEISRINKNDLSWQSLACGNYLMFLPHFRSFYHESIGYLGLLEALTPARFSKITRAGKRLGLSDEALEFHASHSALDLEHAQGWIDKIILPEIAANPNTIKPIATGVLLRELVSKRYWDALDENCRMADALATNPNPASNPALRHQPSQTFRPAPQ